MAVEALPSSLCYLPVSDSLGKVRKRPKCQIKAKIKLAKKPIISD